MIHTPLLTHILHAGESKLSRTGIQCSMLEVSLPVALLAAMILRVPLKAASEE